MRNRISYYYKTLGLLVLLALFLIPGSPAKAADTLEVEAALTFGQSDARKVADMINTYRVSGDAWCLDSDGVTKKPYGQLKALEYDCGLEKIAMQRAAECAAEYSHTRPDGTSWVTAFNFYGIISGVHSECIGYGFMTPLSIFEGWMEEANTYEKQGHRRAILDSSYLYVGVGHVISDGIHYWALELSSVSSGVSDTASTDGVRTVELSIARDRLRDAKLLLNMDSDRVSHYDEDIEAIFGEPIDCSSVLFASCGENFSVPTYNIALSTANGLHPIRITCRLDFVSDNPECVDYQGGMVSAYSEGLAVLSAEYEDYLLQIPTIVQHDFDEGVTEAMPSCTEYGSVLYTCKGCKATYVEMTDCLGHNFESYKIAATPNHAGAIGERCTRCGSLVGAIEIFQIGELSLSAATFSYESGTARKPKVTVRDIRGNEIAPSNYTVKYKGYAQVGRAIATVTFNDDSYSGSLTAEYLINPRRVYFKTITPARKAFTASWTRVIKKNTGYELEYSTKKSFEGSKIVIASDAKKKSVKVKGLKAKTLYYVRIRSYREVKGEKFYSEWSGVKTVRTK